MGIRIIVEILDHYRDHGLTMGERDDLIVLAENANDTTRETFGPVHEEYTRRRAGGKSKQAWKNSIRTLMVKKVLEHAVHHGVTMTGRVDRHAATVRHNRARGVHGVDAMSDLVLDLARRGWSDEKIGKELGMEPDEVLRLKQVQGLAALFADEEFSEAWEAAPADAS